MGVVVHCARTVIILFFAGRGRGGREGRLHLLGKGAVLTSVALALSHSLLQHIQSTVCTTKSLAPGKLLYHLRMADAVYVQWEGLTRTYPRAVYAGRIM